MRKPRAGSFRHRFDTATGGVQLLFQIGIARIKCPHLVFKRIEPIEHHVTRGRRRRAHIGAARGSKLIDNPLFAHIVGWSGTGLSDCRCRDSEREKARAEETRSEEHTSELQSLMRISYAVFCLKKKNNKK